MNKIRIKRITTLSLLMALVVIFQLIATYINFGSFPITLTLIPIIVGACAYGPIYGGLLGLVFGGVVSIMVITGQDPSGAVMFSMHPIITITTCLIKGFLAGYISGLIYKYININNKIKLIISAAACPIINTLILCLSLILFFDNGITILIGLFLSTNFVIELVINMCLAPGLIAIINRINKRYN